MKRVCDESRISNKHFINDLSFKLNIKQNKIRLPRPLCFLTDLKSPALNQLGPRTRNSLKMQSNIYQRKLVKLRNYLWPKF